jgi:zinc D-Ala-D-Ala carboxypeptidase
MTKYPVNISPNVTFAEAVRSDKAKELGIKNYPDSEQLENMKYIALNVFEVVREKVAKGKPVIVSSFFRCKELNSKIKRASKTSQHMKGEAMDLKKSLKADYTNAEIFRFIRDHLEFDQLIWEYGDMNEPDWVHVSLSRTGKNRRQIIYSR